MNSIKSQAGWLVMALALVALVLAPDLGAMRAIGQLGPNETVNPDVYADLEFRSLEDAFARGGRATAVTGVIQNQQRYFMGSTGGGVWRTDDAGTTWQNVSDGFFEVGSIGAIQVAPSNPDVIYVGTGSACPRGNVSTGLGVYKSMDGGDTWSQIGLRTPSQIGRIRVHPTNPDIAYVAVLGNMFGPNPERGVYRTRDGGSNWELVHFISDRTGAVDLTMDPEDPNILIAAMWTTIRQPWTIESGSTEGGMFRTTDGGDTWTKLTGGLPNDVMVGRIGVSISGADSNRVYAQIEAGGDQGGTYRSDDGGLNWTRTYEGRNLQQRAWYYTHIFADPVDVDTVYALNTGAFKSTDGGKTFQSAGIQSHGDHHDLWINPENNTAIINSNDGGANVSVDGGPWSPQNNQPTAEIYRVTTDSRWPYWVYGAQQDNSTVAVPSVGVQPTYGVGGGESAWIAVDPRNHNVNYAGNYGGSLSRQDRSGATEGGSVRVYADSQTGQRAADMKYRQQWNAPIMISPHTPDVVYTTSQYVHRTTNAGLDWEVISPDLTRNDRTRQQYSGGEGITRDSTGVEVYSTIFVLEESPIAPGNLWAGSDDGLIHVSRDNGATWTNVTPGDWPDGVINAISLSQHNAGKATVAMYRYRQADFRPHLFQTTDYGATWRRIADGTNGIPDWHFTRVVREDPVQEGLLYAGSEFGLYISFDNGEHWQSFQNNLPITPVTDLQIKNDDLVISTQGRAFWILSDLSVVRGLGAQVQGNSEVLFKPSTAYRTGGRPPTFHYWLPNAPGDPVTVRVTDPEGEVVWDMTAEPGTAVPAMNLGAGGGGRGGRGGGGGGGGGAQAAAAGRAGGRGAAAVAGRGAAAAGRGGAAAGRGAQQAARGGGGGRGGGGAAAGAGGSASAVQGLNRAIWTSMTYDAPFQSLPGAVMWGARGGGGPKMAPGTYTVQVSSGSWSASEEFTLKADPAESPEMTPEEGAEQLRMARDIGAATKQLYDDVLAFRDLKTQAAEYAETAGPNSPVAAAAATLKAALEAVEGDMTQMQGSAGQDSLNFPGRMDNQTIVLYGQIVSPERRLGTAVRERYADLKPEVDALLQRAVVALRDDVAAFNQVATSAGLAAIAPRNPGGGN